MSTSGTSASETQATICLLSYFPQANVEWNMSASINVRSVSASTNYKQLPRLHAVCIPSTSLPIICWFTNISDGKGNILCSSTTARGASLRSSLACLKMPSGRKVA
ncbi:hypothetical protein B0H10DRAFT_2214369 [Mycena sp. CBHHK59/15]|nr:hypothetical protein B0H10DRAFT_2214369 [Mycena sp. CBHHK59/15]